MDPKPGAEDDARAGGVEHDTTTASAVAERRVGGVDQVMVHRQDGGVRS